MKILMVLTSHDKLGNKGENTGFWLEEFAAPYYVFKDAGEKTTLVSLLGGQPPLDPKNDDPASPGFACSRLVPRAEAKMELLIWGQTETENRHQKI